MWLIKFLWRVIRNIKTILITAILLISLVLNVILFAGGSLFSLVNTGFEALTGVQTVASRNKSEIVSLGDELAREKKINKDLQDKLVDLEKQNNDLSQKRMITFKGKTIPVEKAVDETADIISKRASITATREIASM